MKSIKFYSFLVLSLCIVAVSTTSAVKVKFGTTQKTVEQAHVEVFDGDTSESRVRNLITFD